MTHKIVTSFALTHKALLQVSPRLTVEDCVASKDILIVFVGSKKNNIKYCKVVKSARVVSLRLSESLYIRVNV